MTFGSEELDDDSSPNEYDDAEYVALLYDAYSELEQAVALAPELLSPDEEEWYNAAIDDGDLDQLNEAIEFLLAKHDELEEAPDADIDAPDEDKSEDEEGEDLDPDDPIDILAKVGGFEIGGIAGLILGAAAQKIPVVVDGFISSAGAALALKLNSSAGDYIFPSHISSEPGHKIFFDMLGHPPLFDLNMRLGEGTGALLATNLIQSAVKIYNEMATFQSAGVSTKQSSQ